MGCAQWYGLQPCLPENKFFATMTTTHTALRADKTEQKVELRSSKNASLNKKPSGLIAIAQLIMCCKTINNNFRNLNPILKQQDAEINQIGSPPSACHCSHGYNHIS